MRTTREKIREAVEQGRVKLHVFEPSNRRMWTVVGSGGEYWVEPDLEFCSCAGFYFSGLCGRAGCYHLKSLRAAVEARQHETVRFSDEEYAGFIASLIPQL